MMMILYNFLLHDILLHILFVTKTFCGRDITSQIFLWTAVICHKLSFKKSHDSHRVGVFSCSCWCIQTAWTLFQARSQFSLHNHDSSALYVRLVSPIDIIYWPAFSNFGTSSFNRHQLKTSYLISGVYSARLFQNYIRCQFLFCHKTPYSGSAEFGPFQQSLQVLEHATEYLLTIQ